MINSVKNFRVLQWLKLKQKAQRGKQGCFLVEGYHLAAEARRANCLTEIITTDKTAPFDVASHQVAFEVMEKLTSMATPAKIIGVCRKPETARAVGAWGDSILLADRIHHAGNLGTIIRSAAAFGVDTVVVDGTADVYSPKVIQASQGMIFHVNIVSAPIEACLADLKASDYQIISTDVREGIDLRGFTPKRKRAVLIGSEGDGVGADLLKYCDVRLHIPMSEKCESLNAGVAASIILYQMNTA